MEVQLRTILQFYWLVILQDVNSWTSRKNSEVVSASVSSGTQQKKWKKPHLEEKKEKKNSTIEVAEMKWH